MSDDNGQPPFEKPCVGSAQGCQRTAGNYYQHKISADSAIPRYVNTTNPKPSERFRDTHEDGSCAAQGSPINPAYTIPYANQTFTQPQMLIAIAIANPGDNYHPSDILTVAGGTVTPGSSAAQIVVLTVGGDGTTGPILKAAISTRGSYLSGNPISPNTPTGGAGSGAQFTLTFENETKDFSSCKIPGGWKGVQVNLAWNGQFGYTSHEYGASPAVDNSDTLLWCDATFSYIAYESAQATPDSTKYLVKTINSSWSWTDYSTDPPTTFSNSVSDLIVSVNQNAGLASVSGSASGTFVQGWTSDATTWIYVSDWTRGDIIARLLSHIYLVASAPDTPYPTTWSGTDTGGTFKNYSQATGNVTEQLDYDMATGSYTYQTWSEWTNEDLSISLFPTNYEKATVTSTEFDFELDTYFYPCAPTTQQKTSVSITSVLSGSNTSAAIKTDRNTLGSTWPLNDNVLYPPRTDLHRQIVPLVSRDQPPEPVLPTGASSLIISDADHPITPDSSGYADTDPLWTPAFVPRIVQNPLAGSTTLFFYGQRNTTAPPGAVGNAGVTNAALWEISGGALPSEWNLDTATGIISGTATDASLTYYFFNITVTGIAATDGLIKGMPMPRAFSDVNSFYYIEGFSALPGTAFEDFFQWHFVDWALCCADSGENLNVQYKYGFGMWLSDYIAATGAQIPLCATQWSNKNDSITKTPGASQTYNDPTTIGDGPCGAFGFGASNVKNFQSMKYMEMMDEWDGENWARPGGDDKFLWIENDSSGTDAVFSAVNISGSGAGSTWTVTDYTGATPPDAAIASGIWGGAVFGGFYNVSYSSGVLTLGPKVYNLPTGWKASQGQTGDDAVAFGQLRFPTCPSILGRALVTPDSTGIIFTFTDSQPNFGMAVAGTEQIDLWDGGMNLIAANITATRTDDTHFTTAAAYMTARYATITSAPFWYFNSTEPKGYYGLFSWLFDFRTDLERTRLTGTVDCSGTQVSQPAQNNGYDTTGSGFIQSNPCLALTPCNPRVVCVTFNPDVDTFPGGNVVTMPDFVFDERYGSKWQHQLMVTMTDLLWQRPHHPLGGRPAINPIPPQREVRLALPSDFGLGSDESAPALPSGITIGYLSPVDYTTGNVLYPPPPLGFVDNENSISSATAFQIHSELCADESYDGGARRC